MLHNQPKGPLMKFSTGTVRLTSDWESHLVLYADNGFGEFMPTDVDLANFHQVGWEPSEDLWGNV
jgi:hypothetical protein